MCLLFYFGDIAKIMAVNKLFLVYYFIQQAKKTPKLTLNFVNYFIARH